jgi:hypothetical protein
MDTHLNMGFRDQLDEILKFLPPPAQRQTLLFSATLPSEVRTVISQYTRQSARITELDGLSPQLVYIDCVHDNDPSTHTNSTIWSSSRMSVSHQSEPLPACLFCFSMWNSPKRAKETATRFLFSFPPRPKWPTTPHCCVVLLAREFWKCTPKWLRPVAIALAHDFVRLPKMLSC